MLSFRFRLRVFAHTSRPALGAHSISQDAAHPSLVVAVYLQVLVLGEAAVVVLVPSMWMASLMFFRDLDSFDMTLDLAMSFASASLSIYDTP
jgi:hypothetical protein